MHRVYRLFDNAFEELISGKKAIHSRSIIKDDDFLRLCLDGTFEKIKKEIKNGANVNAKNDIGITALMIAAGHNNDERVTRELINAGADVNAKNIHGITPIMTAALHNSNPKIIRVLISSGANIHSLSESGLTPFLMAAGKNENPEILRELVALGENVNIKAENGITALLLAAFNSTPTIVNTLIDMGADVNATDNDGINVLHYAYENKKLVGSDALRRLESLTKSSVQFSDTKKSLQTAKKAPTSPAASRTKELPKSKSRKLFALKKFGTLNCAQAVIVTYADLVGLNEETAKKVSAGFGSGMGAKETCGALSALIVLAGLKGVDSKKRKEMGENFQKLVGARMCADVLEKYGKEHCKNCVLAAAEIVEKDVFTETFKG